MKRGLNIKGLIVAIVAMAICAVCCQGEFDNFAAQRPSVVVTLTADMDLTRSAFGEKGNTGYKSNWSGNETALFNLNGASTLAEATNSSAGASAKFSVKLTSDGKTSGTIRAFAPKGIYSATGTCKGGFTGINTKYKDLYVVIPDVQTPLAGSCDESAHLLTASLNYTNGLPSSGVMTFRHVAAYGKMKIANLSTPIASVTITSPVALAGKSCYYYYDGTNVGQLLNANVYSITLNATNVEDNIFWFGCAPASLGNKGDLKIEITATNGQTYSKSISMSGRTLDFVQGEVSSFVVDMENVDGGGSGDITPPAPVLSSLEAGADGSKAWAGCVVENPQSIANGEVRFVFNSSNGSTTTASYNVGTTETYAMVSDITLAAASYDVYATCTATDGSTINSNHSTLTIKSAANAPSESWLELPAVRTDGRYPNAAEYKVMESGERNYTHYYDTSTYTTMWVAYPIEAKHMGSYSRPNNWSYNPLINEAYQVNLCSRSYTSTYVRGHLIPNAARNGIKNMQLQTFYVTNSVPQIHENFNSGIWSNLEAAIQSIGESEIVYVVTGVAFAKEGETKTINYTTAKDDTKNIPVPNYFYKVVLKVTTNSAGTVTAASTIGFWFENKAYSDTYDKYAVSVDHVETWTGFDYFANLPDAIETTAETNASWTTFKNF